MGPCVVIDLNVSSVTNMLQNIGLHKTQSYKDSVLNHIAMYSHLLSSNGLLTSTAHKEVNRLKQSKTSLVTKL